MTFLQLTEGRLEAASIGYLADGDSRAAVLRAVRGQLVDVLGRPLLPLGWTEVDRGHALTALDPSGQVVTVEVLDELEPAGLLTALARQHQAAGAGRARLAAGYPGGTAAFSQDWNEFREALPVHVEPGPSLIVLTCAVSADVHESASLLGGSGVEVHLVDVRVLEEPMGRRVIVGIERVRSDGVTGGAPLLVARAPRRRLASASSPAQGPGSAVRARRVAGPDTAPVPGPAAAPQPAPEAGALPTGVSTAAPGLHDALTAPTAAPGSHDALPAPTAAPGSHDALTAPSAASPREAEEPQDGAAGVTHRSDAPVLGAAPTVPAGQASARALAQVAAGLDAPVPLVWRSLRRGINHEAVLETEGRIRLADGRVFTDPSLAANAAHHTRDVDGWRVWRVGPGGPSLDRLLRQIQG